MVKLLMEKFAIYPSSSIKLTIMNIAIVGATGNVGRKILEVLREKRTYILIIIFGSII